MKLQVAIVATAAGLAAATATPDSAGGQYPGCSSGQGKRSYDQGARLATSAFTTSWKFLDQDCGQLEVLVDIMDETAPYKPYCKTLGYIDALYESYAQAQQDCFQDCKDSGEVTGYALAGQFCTITQAAVMAMTAFGAPQQTTLAICNEIEQKKCESKYASEVNKNCPEAKAENMEYYNELKKSCKIADTPASGGDKPPASDNPPCDPCDTGATEPPAFGPPPAGGSTTTPPPPEDTGKPDTPDGIDCTTPGQIDTRC